MRSKEPLHREPGMDKIQAISHQLVGGFSQSYGFIPLASSRFALWRCSPCADPCRRDVETPVHLSEILAVVVNTVLGSHFGWDW